MRNEAAPPLGNTAEPAGGAADESIKAELKKRRRKAKKKKSKNGAADAPAARLSLSSAAIAVVRAPFRAVGAVTESISGAAETLTDFISGEVHEKARLQAQERQQREQRRAEKAAGSAATRRLLRSQPRSHHPEAGRI